MAEQTGFVGLSHLGLVSSICWASLGGPVVGVDVDEEAVGRLNRQTFPVHEPGLEERFVRHRRSMTFGTDFTLLEECPLVFIARDVPTDEKNAGDVAVVLDLVDRVVPHLRAGAVLVVMSQVPVGFTRALRERIRGARPDLAFELIYWVETLIFGNAVERCLHPERVILGCLEPKAPLPGVLEAGVRRFDAPVLPMRYESAELAKGAVNILLYASVSCANTLSELCETVGADWSEIVPALRMDKRIGGSAYLRPSLGVAGGNLERDLSSLRALCRENGVDSALLDSLKDYNAGRYEWVLQRLRRLVFEDVAHPTIGIWGLAYKKNTHSTKDSFSLRLIQDLRDRATLRIYDPVVPAVKIEGSDPAPDRVESPEEALAGADALVIMTDWDEFAAIDGRKLVDEMRRSVVIDCVGVLEDVCLGVEGVQYVSMGRSPDAAEGGGA